MGNRIVFQNLEGRFLFIQSHFVVCPNQTIVVVFEKGT